jgi:curved DNA-binding protein CbpA
VRARLEAEASRLAAERSTQRPASSPTTNAQPRKVPSGPKTGPKSGSMRALAPRLDLEREQARTKKELNERLERMNGLTLYERLGVSRRASGEDIRTAEQKLLRDHHPDRVVPGTPSREVRALAERIYLEIVRAHDVLTDPEARSAYDRDLGTELESQRIAPLVYAEQAFQHGRRAAEANQWEIARDLFREASEMCSTEGTYVAHLAVATFMTDPTNEQAWTTASALFDRAIVLSPRTEEIHLLRGAMHQKLGQRAEAVRDYEAAVRANPDSVEALRALKSLEPPSARKTGLLSRLIES